MQADRHTGRTVIVTGAASGIGRGIARRFGEEGANVVVADVRDDPKQGEYYDSNVERPTDEVVRAETSGDATFIETDVSDPDQAAAMAETAVDEYGRLDVVVNNAGIFTPGDSQAVTVKEWREVIGVNLDGVFYCSKYAIPYLKDAEGHLINIGSVNASEGGAGPPYTSAKAGVVNLTRDLAVELGEYNVNVNAICPGFVKTAMQDYHGDETLQRQHDHTLLPEAGTPEDIGNAAVFLASDEASFVHGQAIYVDGGWTAHRL